MKTIFQVCDLTDPFDPQHRTYREINNAQIHKFDINDLVEIESGVRAFIHKQLRDCDGTPLYSLGVDDKENRSDYNTSGGFGEDHMKLIKKGNN